MLRLTFCRERARVQESFQNLFSPDSGHLLRDENVSHFFMLETEHANGKESKTTRFAVQHVMRRTFEDVQLQKFAAKEKLLPWIACAIPVEPIYVCFCVPSSTKCRLSGENRFC
jgi:hypothetical protein